MCLGHLKSLARKITETENELKLFLQRGQLQSVTLTATPLENEDIDTEPCWNCKPNGTRLPTHVMLLLFRTVYRGGGRAVGCIRYKHLWVLARESQRRDLTRALLESKMLFLVSPACAACVSNEVARRLLFLIRQERKNWTFNCCCQGFLFIYFFLLCFQLCTLLFKRTSCFSYSYCVKEFLRRRETQPGLSSSSSSFTRLSQKLNAYHKCFIKVHEVYLHGENAGGHWCPRSSAVIECAVVDSPSASSTAAVQWERSSAAKCAR